MKKKTADKNMVDNTIKIVITNSHADNRGDEAAQRSLISTLGKLVPHAEFTVLTISPEGLDLQKDVRILKTFSASVKTIPLLIFWLTFRFFGIKFPTSIENRRVLKALKQLEDADVIISAPGGPYFGDLYASHEIREHLLHILIAKILRKPVMIYAPSMGPFKISWRNLIRRYFLNKVEIISVRDHISKKYLDCLKLARPLIYLTCDSAFQNTINVTAVELKDIMLAEEIIGNEGNFDKRILVGITPAGARWNFKDAQNSAEKQREYNQTIARAVDYIADKYDAIVVFYPQLYGKSDDVLLINDIVKLVNHKESIRIFSKTRNSEIQQAVISQMDIFLGNRYHSVVFSLKAKIPTVCLAYEHKAVSLMNSMQLGDFVIDMNEFNYENLIDKINKLWNQKEKIRVALKSRIRIIRKCSLLNSILAKALINCAVRHVLCPKALKEEVDELITNFQQKSIPFRND